MIATDNMKAFGVDRKDVGCCPGHDKFPDDKYASRRSTKARAKSVQLAHQRGRTRLKAALKKELKDA